ncbi:MAG: 30S ribosomal protein S13 [Candidatus Brennerbacteria bacterium RIFOXYC1_FULL_41_11]|uniref:Small ribosomal subunit protein uS13 n=1 Tax=Candidatus Brennerbacteria bacterium RIFOXYD1_FULL_41_16 TaxID=1797529 RepID=A0A1G1XJE9_9BACT|nr:MAG: 30S ribosomal protein S13 [Parcubacteria group bacterium GW2011_GWB1_41_4]OGY38827.1 MAG: 30S ribosomal protein S13 [Candidatus Brennerbacteria bacterium RIFOXYB1_FULL_41_13]OGY39108.1 MAG: 30S ribosomal protein S13 [Candidatus Brennerbacteria bacterium RIFOXYC1_FULL_41_11]OGY40265.1 MAG: 30S ribosomal protein S13 [Candidatus Brennerbacteria bacterium RIFOXYD1_FULL_41_16]
MRFAGVNIPDEKRIEVALTYVYGIGLTTSKKILTEASIDFDKKAKTLSTKEMSLLKDIIDKNYRVEGDLRREIFANIKRLKDIKSYRGARHLKKLPVRGQNTKHNSRTVRGNKRVTMTSGRKASAQKT